LFWRGLVQCCGTENTVAIQRRDGSVRGFGLMRLAGRPDVLRRQREDRDISGDTLAGKTNAIANEIHVILRAAGENFLRPAASTAPGKICHLRMIDLE